MGIYGNYINENYNKHKLKKCLIVSCFAGVGKNFAINYLTNKGYIVNSIEKIASIESMFGSDIGYINHINELAKKSDILFIPYFLNMENKYIKGRVDYYLIYPNLSLKNIYIKRFKELKFTKEQISNFIDNWDAMIIDCDTCNIDEKRKIQINDNEYCLDSILNLL